jgi:hypothetical protein
MPSLRGKEDMYQVPEGMCWRQKSWGLLLLQLYNDSTTVYQIVSKIPNFKGASCLPVVQAALLCITLWPVQISASFSLSTSAFIYLLRCHSLYCFSCLCGLNVVFKSLYCPIVEVLRGAWVRISVCNLSYLAPNINFIFSCAYLHSENVLVYFK